MEENDGKNVVLAVTGGSGAILAKGLAEALLRMGMSLFFVCSRYGRLMWREELREPLETAMDEWTDLGNVITFNPGDLAAPIASGSFPGEGRMHRPMQHGDGGLDRNGRRDESDSPRGRRGD